VAHDDSNPCSSRKGLSERGGKLRSDHNFNLVSRAWDWTCKVSRTRFLSRILEFIPRVAHEARGVQSSLVDVFNSDRVRRSTGTDVKRDSSQDNVRFGRARHGLARRSVGHRRRGRRCPDPVWVSHPPPWGHGWHGQVGMHRSLSAPAAPYRPVPVPDGTRVALVVRNHATSTPGPPTRARRQQSG
jgi:hypothetical protein